MGGGLHTIKDKKTVRNSTSVLNSHLTVIYFCVQKIACTLNLQDGWYIEDSRTYTGRFKQVQFFSRYSIEYHRKHLYKLYHYLHSSRFIINIPKIERTGLTRVSFQIELAHWFYLDYYCVQNPELRPYKLKEFFTYIFQVVYRSLI